MRESDHSTVLRRGVAVMVILLLLFGAFAPAAMAAGVWPNCNWQCKAADVRLNRVWLGNCTTGAELGSCVPGSSVTACIWAEFENHDNADRYTIMVLDELLIDGTNSAAIDKCALDYISGKSTSNVSLYQFNWVCGQTVVLKDVIIP